LVFSQSLVVASESTELTDLNTIVKLAENSTDTAPSILPPPSAFLFTTSIASEKLLVISPISDDDSVETEVTILSTDFRIFKICLKKASDADTASAALLPAAGCADPVTEFIDWNRILRAATQLFIDVSTSFPHLLVLVPFVADPLVEVAVPVLTGALVEVSLPVLAGALVEVSLPVLTGALVEVSLPVLVGALVEALVVPLVAESLVPLDPLSLAEPIASNNFPTADDSPLIAGSTTSEQLGNSYDTCFVTSKTALNSIVKFALAALHCCLNGPRPFLTPEHEPLTLPNSAFNSSINAFKSHFGFGSGIIGGLLIT